MYKVKCIRQLTWNCTIILNGSVAFTVVNISGMSSYSPHYTHTLLEKHTTDVHYTAIIRWCFYKCRGIGQHPLHQFPRSNSVSSWRLPHSKSTTSPQHKRQVRNKLTASPSTGKLRGNVNGFWAYRSISVTITTTAKYFYSISTEFHGVCVNIVREPCNCVEML